MNNYVNGVTNLQYSSLVYAITNLQGYKKGESSMQKYYFPIKSLSEAVNNSANEYIEEFSEDTGLTL